MLTRLPVSFKLCSEFLKHISVEDKASHPGDDTNAACCTEDNKGTWSSTAPIVTDSASLLAFSSAQLSKAFSQDKGRPGIAITPESDPRRQHGGYCPRLGSLHLCSPGSDAVPTTCEVLYGQSLTKILRLPIFSHWFAAHWGTELWNVVCKLSVTKPKATLTKIAQQALHSLAQYAVQWNPRHVASAYFML